MGFLLAAACGIGVACLRGAGVSANRAAAIAAAALVAGCAADAGYYYVSSYRPWAAAVAGWRADHPPVPRSELLPRLEPVVEQSPPLRNRSGDQAEWETHFENEKAPFWARSDRPGGERRAYMHRLHTVHTDFAARFAERMEFGVVRMRPMTRRLLRFEDLPAEPKGERIQQPRGGLSRLPSGDAAPMDSVLRDAVAAWHLDRGIDFANEGGFGAFGTPGDEWDDPLPADYEGGEGPFLIGFRSHAAQTTPKDGPLPGWELTGFELIGLILHERPVAYQSDYLPIAGPESPSAVRELTPFESAALERLAAGEWVVGETDADRLRAVGALPAAKACADCHDVPVGRLLGALSYEFVTETSVGAAE
ncbi:hypothetical protein [Alienimonas californiensis]|uniref:Uncharacterized protein n=1 Tax=Alienimonas californiensis TaxID=2527989 RepID=A0A517PDE2_9PLAN|nr:hypothetical protein [Alienimonas californiensis]QDT17395.1 hypothetical protein CA12_35160 [Alienimonas californiensis]